MSTASQIAEKNPELAAELVHDISSKLLAEDKLISKMEAATLAMAMTTYYSSTDKHAEVGLTDDSPNAVETYKMQQRLRPIASKRFRRITSSRQGTWPMPITK